MSGPDRVARRRKTLDVRFGFRGYWSDGGVCRIRVFEAPGTVPVVVCSELDENANTSVTNLAEYLAAEVVEEHSLPTPLTWIEHYPEHEGEIGEYSLVTLSSWELEEVCLGGIWRLRVGVPSWSHLRPEEVEFLLRDRTGEQRPPSTVE